MAEILGLVAGSLKLAATDATCNVRFGADEPFFVGHFPDYPLVPGMILVDGLVALARALTALDQPPVTELKRLDEAKFRAEVRPDDVVSYHVEGREAEGDDRTFNATVSHNARVVLSCRFVLAPAVH